MVLFSIFARRSRYQRLAWCLEPDGAWEGKAICQMIRG